MNKYTIGISVSQDLVITRMELLIAKPVSNRRSG